MEGTFDFYALNRYNYVKCVIKTGQENEGR